MRLWIFSIGRFFGGIPAKVWYILGALAALWLIISFHNKAVETAFNDGNEAGIDATTFAFETAQMKADALQREKNEKKRLEQETITKDLVNEHTKERAAIIARYDAVRVRLEAERAALRASRPGNTASIPGATGGADATTEADELSASVPLSYLVNAELNTEQLMALQEWVSKQMAAWPVGDDIEGEK